eukprot:3730414-Pleurochrysis_carterae.AAC.3
MKNWWSGRGVVRSQRAFRTPEPAYNSAATALTALRFCQATPLYFGVKDFHLPDKFKEMNEDHIAGGIEFGFRYTAAKHRLMALAPCRSSCSYSLNSQSYLLSSSFTVYRTICQDMRSALHQLSFPMFSAAASTISQRLPRPILRWQLSTQYHRSQASSFKLSKACSIAAQISAGHRNVRATPLHERVRSC